MPTGVNGKSARRAGAASKTAVRRIALLPELHATHSNVANVDVAKPGRRKLAGNCPTRRRQRVKGNARGAAGGGARLGDGKERAAGSGGLRGDHSRGVARKQQQRGRAATGLCSADDT